MTEQEWLAGTDTGALLHHCLNTEHGKQALSRRKHILFLCACCRLVWDRLPEPASRQAIEVAEQLADKQATIEQWRAAHGEAVGVGISGGLSMAVTYIADTDYNSVLGSPWRPWTNTDVQQHAALLRDVVGNPYRPADILTKALARWSGYVTSTVLDMAQHIYNERDWEVMPILADALEEAGCNNADVLKHCRSRFSCSQCGMDVTHLVDMDKQRYGGCLRCHALELLLTVHTRGCWVVDLILGKE